MTYYGAKNLADSYRTVRRNTIAIADEIPAEKYAFRPAPETMSVAEMLAHIAAAYQWHEGVHTSHVPSIQREFFMAAQQKEADDQRELVSRGKDAIVQALRDRGERFAAFLESLDEQTLGETVSFSAPFPSKSRFEMLLGVKEHEMHHRGQLMLIQRLLGMVPPLTRARQQQMAASR
jgi:uncharacterized damage-inducible protein DinB